jgi:hypothetical protein
MEGCVGQGSPDSHTQLPNITQNGNLLATHRGGGMSGRDHPAQDAYRRNKKQLYAPIESISSAASFGMQRLHLNFVIASTTQEHLTAI